MYILAHVQWRFVLNDSLAPRPGEKLFYKGREIPWGGQRQDDLEDCGGGWAMNDRHAWSH